MESAKASQRIHHPVALRLELPAPTDDIRYLCAHIADILVRKDMQAQTLSQWTLKIKKQDVKFALQETHRKTSEKVLQGLRVSWFSQVFSVFVLFFLQVSFFSDLEMPGQQNRPKTCWKWCSVLPGSLAEGQTRKGTEHLKVLEGSGGIWRNIGSAWFCHTCDRA